MYNVAFGWVMAHWLLCIALKALNVVYGLDNNLHTYSPDQQSGPLRPHFYMVLLQTLTNLYPGESSRDEASQSRAQSHS